MPDVRRRQRKPGTLGESLRVAFSPAAPSEAVFGEKSIGQFGSFVYLVNQIFGAGILALPLVLKESGWCLCLVANALVCMVAMHGTLMLMRSMTMIRGNQNFERRMEYIPTVKHFLGSKWAAATETAFYLSIQSLNVVSIAIVSQSVDHLLVKIFGWDFGFVIQRDFLGFKGFHSQEQVDIIYKGGSDSTLCFGITLGFLLNAAVCITLSTQSIEENMPVQYVSFTFLICSITQLSANAVLKIRKASKWVLAPATAAAMLRGTTLAVASPQAPDFVSLGSSYTSIRKLLETHQQHDFIEETNLAAYFNQQAEGDRLYEETEPTVTSRSSIAAAAAAAEATSVKYGTTAALHSTVSPPRAFGRYQYGQLFSTFVASYSYNNMIPSWANEMQPGVNVNEAVRWSSMFACIVYYVFGYVMAFAYPSVRSDNVLEEVLADPHTGVITKASVYIFNLLTVLPGVLVFSITTRYNLVNSRKTTPRGGFLIGVLLPFSLAWLFSNDRLFSAVLQWSSLLFSLAVNFVVPSVIYINACGGQRLATRNPTRHFVQLLRYAHRAENAAREVTDVSAHLREYLRGLPESDLDPHVRQLLLSSEDEDDDDRAKENTIKLESLDGLKHSGTGMSSRSSKFLPSPTISLAVRFHGGVRRSHRRHSQPPPSSPDVNLELQRSRPRRKSAPRLDPRDLLRESINLRDLHFIKKVDSLGSSPRPFTFVEEGARRFRNPSSSPPSNQEPLLRSVTASPFPRPRGSETVRSPLSSLASLRSTRLFDTSLRALPTLSISSPTAGESPTKKIAGMTQLAEKLAGIDSMTLLSPLPPVRYEESESAEESASVDDVFNRQSSSLHRLTTAAMGKIKAPLKDLFERIAVPLETSSFLRKMAMFPSGPSSATTEAGAFMRSQTFAMNQVNDKHLMTRSHSSALQACSTTILAPSDRLPGITITTIPAPESEIVPEWCEEHRLPSSLLQDLGLADSLDQSPDSASRRSPRWTPSSSSSGVPSVRQHLAPPSLNVGELPVEPPVDLMVEPMEGAEDAYECDERNSVDLIPLRIHVYPRGLLRTYHITTTIILMMILVVFCFMSVAAQLVVDVLLAFKKLKLPPAFAVHFFV